MMKYIFCIIALLIQPVFSWYVYHKQDKKKAALKMPMLYYSVAYMVVQLYVFFKFCSKFPERYSIYSYLIQAAILLGFVIFEMILWGSNKYIEDVDNERPQMGRIVSRLADVAVVTSDNPRWEQPEKIIEDILPGCLIPMVSLSWA